MVSFIFVLTAMLWIFVTAVNSQLLAEIEYSETVGEFANILLRRFGEKHQARVGLIPPDLLPEIIPIEPDTYNFSSVLLDGFYDQHGSALHGLNSLADDLVLDEAQESALILNYTLSLPEIALRGNYSADLSVNFTYLAEVIPNFPIVIPEEGLIVPAEGTGGYHLSLKQLLTNIRIRLAIVDEIIDSAETSVVLEFEGISVFYDNAKFNGQDFPLWDLVNDLLERTLKELWDNGLKLEIEEILNVVFTELFKGCRASDFIDGDFSCAASTTPPPEPVTTPEPDQCSISGNPCSPGKYCETALEAPYCRCSDQLYAISDYNSGYCRRIDGASCFVDPLHPEYHPCVVNAECVAGNATHGRCECETGYIAAEDGSCAGDVGQNCDSLANQECYEGFMLECFNRKCECASPSLVYETGRGCAAQVGEPCQIYSRIEREARVQCASGLECVEVKVGKHVCQTANAPSGGRSLISSESLSVLLISVVLIISLEKQRN